MYAIELVVAEKNLKLELVGIILLGSLSGNEYISLNI